MGTLHGHEDDQDHEVRPPLNLLQDLKITVHHSSLVLPSQETEKRTIFLSNIDKIVNFDVQTVHFFAAHKDFPDSQIVVEKLKNALAKILVHYDFLAGRLKSNADTCRLEIDCNAAGAGFVVGSSEYGLDEIGDLVYPNPAFAQLACATMEPAAADHLGHPLFILQVTTFKCGGFAMGISNNHTTFDGQSFSQFLGNLAAVAANKPLTVVPYNDRRILAARSPPRVTVPHPELHELKIPASQQQQRDNQLALPVLEDTQEQLDFNIFRLTAADVANLKNKANNNNNTRVITSFNVVTALIWRCRALSSSDSSPSRESTILFAMDIRRRMTPPLPEGYSGNAVLCANASALCGELEAGPFSRAVEMVAEAAARMTDEYVRSFLDWVALHNGFLHGEVVVSSWLRLGFADVEYPWGKPKYSCPVVYYRKDTITLFPDQLAHGGGGGGGGRNCTNGVNILVALPPKEMQKFRALFHKFVQE